MIDKHCKCDCHIKYGEYRCSRCGIEIPPWNASNGGLCIICKMEKFVTSKEGKELYKKWQEDKNFKRMKNKLEREWENK